MVALYSYREGLHFAYAKTLLYDLLGMPRGLASKPTRGLLDEGGFPVGYYVFFCHYYNFFFVTVMFPPKNQRSATARRFEHSLRCVATLRGDVLWNG